MINIFTDFSVIHYGYFLVVVVFAGLVHGAIGLGFPMVATPLIAIFLDVRLAILLTLLPTVTVNIASIWKGSDYRNSLHQFKMLFVCTFAGSILGAFLLATYDPSPFRLVLAVLILLYLWVTLSGRVSGGWADSNNRWLMMGFGIAGGTSAGITNVMVAVLIIYFIGMGMGRGKMVPILNTCFLIGKLSQIGVLSLVGMVGLTLIFQTLPLALASLLALFAGQRIGAKISVEVYSNILHRLLLALALILMIQFYLSWQAIPV